MIKYQSARGFSLLEMSIVLLIIAVLVGGVLVGRSMLLSSQMQTIITDVNNFTTAIGQFKQTYQALPGDFNNATAQWGTDSSGCPSGGGTSGTCNGDGNGKIGENCISGTQTNTNDYESFRAWQHLNSAGFFVNALSGISASASVYKTSMGGNTPKGPIDGSGFVLTWLDDPSSCSNAQKLLTSSGAYGNALIFTRSTTGDGVASHGLTFSPILTPDQAASIDAKMDDGVPGTGNVRSFGTNTASCATTTVASTAAYALTTTSVACAPIFLTGY